jgi:hypothetical protein
MIKNIQNIVQEIDKKVNADSVTSKNNTAKFKKGTKSSRNKSISNSQPTLAGRIASRLIKYKKFMSISHPEDSKKLRKSGNNPLYAYPSIPPPLHNDPKYSRNSPNYTKFATKTIFGGSMNPQETVGKNLGNCRSTVLVSKIKA